MPRDLIPSEVRDFSGEQIVDDLRSQTMTDSQRDEFERTARDFILTREQRMKMEKAEKPLKERLTTMLAEFGDQYGSDNQHRAIELLAPVRGIKRVVRQVKSVVKPDVQAAEALARQRGLYDRWFVMRPVLDEDAVMVSLLEGLVTDDEVAAIFPKHYTYAITVDKK